MFYIKRADSELSVDKALTKYAEAQKPASAGALPHKAGSRTDRKNKVRDVRESLLMSKAELARKAGLSVLTVGRIESGINCRMDTKRKIILALGMTLADKEKVFPES
jgi:DNA-binding XRE family transcriptional regulator